LNNTRWPKKDNQIKRETQDEDNDENLQEPKEIINLKSKRGAFVLEIRDPREHQIRPNSKQ